MKLNKLFWNLMLTFNWAVIVYFWLKTYSGVLGDDWAGTLIAFGGLSGLAAASSVLTQFFFMGRMPWLERAYGLDVLSRLHAKNGKIAFYFLIAHPLLIITGYAMAAKVGLWTQFLNLINNFPYVLWALIGLLLFVAVIALSIKMSRSRLKYENWYFIHLAVYVAMGLAVWHQFANGATLHDRVFYIYWICLYIAVFSSHLAFRFIRPVVNFYRFGFKVDHLVRESIDAMSVYIVGRNLHQFHIQPGQFMKFRFFKKGLWWQDHPFSLSMMPDGKHLRITVRELGDFTRQIKDLQPGTKIMIDGPYGVFTNLFGIKSKVLMIAGGIGITPVRSLMEEMLSKGKDVVLVYANRNEQVTVFRNELTALEHKYGARIIHVMSDQPDWQGEKGKLDKEKIQRLVPDLLAREVYLCGPPPMMESIIKQLMELKLPHSLIHYEKFSLG